MLTFMGGFESRIKNFFKFYYVGHRGPIKTLANVDSSHFEKWRFQALVFKNFPEGHTVGLL